MDIGNLVVDLGSAAIVLSVFTVSVARKERRSSRRRAEASEDLDARGYYDADAAEPEDDTQRG